MSLQVGSRPLRTARESLAQRHTGDPHMPARSRKRFDRPPKITLSVNETCPLNCLHCYGDCGSKSRPELSTAEWLTLIDQLAADGVIQFYIEGGDPFHRPDFFTLLERCCSQAMTLVRSGGTTIDAHAARRVRDVGVGRMFIDLMGATAATHEFFTQVPGSFARSCEAVRLLRDAGVAVDVLVILTRQTAGELTALAALAHQLGAERLGVLRLYPLGRAKRRWPDLALSLDEQAAALAALRPPPGLGVMQSWHPRDRNCCWQAAAINAYGDSIGCMYLREYVNFGNIRDVPFLDTWDKDPLYNSLRAGHVEESCPDCSAHSGSDGGCRAAAYAFHGRWTAPDPFCATLNRGTDLRVLPS
jgi:radical SAM protein with 4Fe4S-binding SPASM domain